MGVSNFIHIVSFYLLPLAAIITLQILEIGCSAGRILFGCDNRSSTVFELLMSRGRVGDQHWNTWDIYKMTFSCRYDIEDVYLHLLFLMVISFQPCDCLSGGTSALMPKVFCALSACLQDSAKLQHAHLFCGTSHTKHGLQQIWTDFVILHL